MLCGFLILPRIIGFPQISRIPGLLSWGSGNDLYFGNEMKCIYFSHKKSLMWRKIMVSTIVILEDGVGNKIEVKGSNICPGRGDLSDNTLPYYRTPSSFIL